MFTLLEITDASRQIVGFVEHSLSPEVCLQADRWASPVPPRSQMPTYSPPTSPSPPLRTRLVPGPRIPTCVPHHRPARHHESRSRMQGGSSPMHREVRHREGGSRMRGGSPARRVTSSQLIYYITYSCTCRSPRANGKNVKLRGTVWTGPQPIKMGSDGRNIAASRRYSAKTGKCEASQLHGDYGQLWERKNHSIG